MKLHRVQVVLGEDEWAEVQRLAHRLALIGGRRVSASEALKELVARGLAEEAKRKEGYLALLEELSHLGGEAPLGQDLMEEDRRAHDERLGP